MKSRILLMAVPVLALGAAVALPAVWAADVTSGTAAASTAQGPQGQKFQGRHGMHRGHDLFGGALRQLNLSADQKTQVHSILSAARQQARAQRSGKTVDRLALANPGDPNHPLAVQAAQAAAVARLNQWNSVQQQVYDVLTPAQKAQLPTLLAQLQQQRQQRVERWKAAHPSSAG